jgi:hypothetical protein
MQQCTLHRAKFLHNSNLVFSINYWIWNLMIEDYIAHCWCMISVKRRILNISDLDWVGLFPFPRFWRTMVKLPFPQLHSWFYRRGKYILNSKSVGNFLHFSLTSFHHHSIILNNFDAMTFMIIQHLTLHNAMNKRENIWEWWEPILTYALTRERIHLQGS